jgi:integrase/recombinase XerD
MKSEIKDNLTNPLPSSLVEEFFDRLHSEQYSQETIAGYRHAVQRLINVVVGDDLEWQMLTPAAAVALVKPKARNAGYRLKAFVRFLGEKGIAAPPPALSKEELGRNTLRAEFEAYLRDERGMSERTIRHASYMARRFLAFRFGEAQDQPGEIAVKDISDFLAAILDRKSPFRDKTVSTHLRSFFGFLFQTGKTRMNHAKVVPRVAIRHGTRLPRHLKQNDVEAVLEQVRKAKSSPRRDYAMLLLMARYGLRAPEVIAIQLDDIDWRTAEILVRGKGQLHDRLPLLPDVGAALEDYLQLERRGQTRDLFVSARPPHKPFKDSQRLNQLLRGAYGKLGLKPPAPYVGSHILRHSLATNLLQKGASLNEIADTLRHRSRTTTLKYARLDVEGLRTIARPWPTAEDAA